MSDPRMGDPKMGDPTVGAPAPGAAAGADKGNASRADWIFGMDGGGTSSRLRVESAEGGLLHYAEGGSTNLRSNGPEKVLASLAGLFESAYRAGLDPARCRAGFAGSAGAGRPPERALLLELLGRASGLACPLDAGNDAETALAGALGDSEGMILIAGTGSIAYGRLRNGESARAGGWGHLLGDEGSAYWIAFQALARALRSSEGRDLPTGLLEAAKAHFGLREGSDLVPLVYEGLDKTRIAGFARLVAAARDSDDPLALHVYARAAQELVGLVASVDARIGERLGRRRLSLRGGLVEGDPRLGAEIAALVKKRLPGIELVAPLADAAVGACVLARSLLQSR